ncbi:Putative elongator complex protein [Septoria linicola]|uniref:Elongator complex protein 1 n=1 Tax=Septoria linicola TaxID=215465 RepID=A0A9Q9ER94_9PEZI|nr:Putative elongator complex protein [Septoria linicola]
MRNLRNISHTAIKFDSSSTSTSPLTATSWQDSHTLICAFGPTLSDPSITLKRFSATSSSTPSDGTLIASWDAPSPNPENLPFDKILTLHCHPDEGSISLILEGGDIILVREDPEDGEEGRGQVEIVGSVDAGIAAAEWSPDEELLLIYTKPTSASPDVVENVPETETGSGSGSGNSTLLFMTREFEGLATVQLSAAKDLEVSSHVNVGWGKKETQFLGPGARAKGLKDPTVPDKIDRGVLSRFDDEERVAISWRGDGEFVAVNSVVQIESPPGGDGGEVRKRRVVRVYSREGVLESVSEPVDGLEAALAWKPSGQLIAGIQRRETEARIDVVFFERNGLRHGEFELRLTAVECQTIGTKISLDWNSDSSVLAVSMQDRVQLWTMGNYHYYLKQEILRGGEGDGGVVTNWHAEKPLQLACYTGQGMRLLNYSFEVARGSTKPPFDHGIVAVIDGKRLKITPLRTANVPPPMAFDEVDLPDNATDVAVDPTGMRIAVLHSDRVSVLNCNYGAKPAKRANVLETLHLDAPPGTASRQLCFDGEGGIVVLSATPNEQGTRVSTISDFGTSDMRIDTAVSHLFRPTNHDRILFENNKGMVHDLATKEVVGTLPATCPHAEVWQGEEGSILFGLTSGGLLHIQSDLQKLKISGCTSFAVTHTHLVYTTSSHLLKFVHLHTNGELEIPPDEPEKDERCRNIERGAKLVTVMPSAYSLILQMPRGNLETIYPRALVLAGIRHEIGRREYKKAFLICRTQRVDMNILHDYAPEEFMKDVDLFIKQVKKVEYVDLFLSSLSEEDVSQTIYKETHKAQDSAIGINGLTNGDAAHQATPTVSKVNKICNAFLKALAPQEATYLQSIITAHVCKDPPDLPAGLSLVSTLRKQGKQDQLEQAVDHICFLADPNRLYDTALGIYDLDVTLLVAQQSQKDPREYLPYLQSLQDMEPLRQRFAIDNDLKRHVKALGHLHALEAFEEVKNYAEKHELYSHAIELYRYDNARLTELMRIYAGFLLSRNRYQEAGIAFEYIGDYNAAFEAYRSVGSLWRECLACTADMSEEKIETTARDLAEGCEESKDYTSAATIHLDYLNDLPEACRLLCKAYSFSSAIRLATLKKQPSLLKSTIDPGLIETSATTTELLAEMKTQLSHQLPRLRDLRQKKLADPMSFLDGAGAADHPDIPDDISLAPTDATTSAGTFMTRYTNKSNLMGSVATDATRKTSKNRKKEERKRARGKKGTVYEEEYLVNSIERLIERLNETSSDVSRLVEGLMRRGMRERAVAVEAAFLEVEGACKACLGEVFQVDDNAATKVQEEQQPGQAGLGPEMHRPWGGEGVLFEALTANRKEAPIVKGFERLGLLER